jgi:hypothetical protein
MGQATIGVTPGSGANVEVYTDSSSNAHPVGVMEFVSAGLPVAVTSSNPLPIAIISGATSGSNAAASATAAAVPAYADYVGLNVGGNLKGQTGVMPAGSIIAAQTDLSSVGGASFGLGQQLAAGSLPVVLTAAQVAALTPVSTVTANIGTTNGLALDASVAALNVAQGAALGSNTGPMVQGSVLTGAPSYTTGQIAPLSLTTNGLLRVNGSNGTFPASQTGTWTVGLSAGAQVEMTDGTNVLGTSSHPVRTDPTGTTTQPVSIASAVAVTGTFWQSTQPVSLASLPALAAGTNAIGTVSITAATTGGATPFSFISAGGANQDSTQVKASSGQLYGWALSNTTASNRYVKVYNKAAPASTDTPVLRLLVPPGGGNNHALPVGLAFGTAIGFRVTTGIPDNDVGAASANDVFVNFNYD